MADGSGKALSVDDDAAEEASVTSSKRGDMANWRSKQCKLCSHWSNERSPYRNASENDVWVGLWPWHDWVLVFVISLSREVKMAVGRCCSICFNVWRTLGDDLKHGTLAKYYQWVLKEPEVRHIPFLNATRQHIRNRNCAFASGFSRVHDREDLTELVTKVSTNKRSGKRFVDRIYWITLEDYKANFGEPAEHGDKAAWEETSDGTMMEGVHIAKGIVDTLSCKVYEVELYNDVNTNTKTTHDDGSNVLSDKQQSEKHKYLQKTITGHIQTVPIQTLLDAMSGRTTGRETEKGGGDSTSDSDDPSEEEEEVDYRKKALATLCPGPGGAAKSASTSSSVPASSKKPGGAAKSASTSSSVPASSKKPRVPATTCVVIGGGGDQSPGTLPSAAGKRGPGRPPTRSPTTPKDIVQLSSRNLSEKQDIIEEAEGLTEMTAGIDKELSKAWDRNTIEADKYVHNYFKELAERTEKHQKTLEKLSARLTKYSDTGGRVPAEVKASIDTASNHIDAVTALAKQMGLANPKVSFMKRAFERVRELGAPVPLSAMCKDFDLRVSEVVLMGNYNALIASLQEGGAFHNDFKTCPHFKLPFLEMKVITCLEALVMKLGRTLTAKDLSGPLDKGVKFNELLSLMVNDPALLGRTELQPESSVVLILSTAKTVAVAELANTVKTVTDAKSNKKEGSNIPPLVAFMYTGGGGQHIFTWAKEVLECRGIEIDDGNAIAETMQFLVELGADWPQETADKIVEAKKLGSQLLRRYRNTPQMKRSSQRLVEQVADVTRKQSSHIANKCVNEALGAMINLIKELDKAKEVHNKETIKSQITKAFSFNAQLGKPLAPMLDGDLKKHVDAFETYFQGACASFCEVVAINLLDGSLDRCDAELVQQFNSPQLRPICEPLLVEEQTLRHIEAVVHERFRECKVGKGMAAREDLLKMQETLLDVSNDPDLPDSMGEVLGARYDHTHAEYLACTAGFGKSDKSDFSHVKALCKGWCQLREMMNGKALSKSEFLQMTELLVLLKEALGEDNAKLQVLTEKALVCESQVDDAGIEALKPKMQELEKMLNDIPTIPESCDESKPDDEASFQKACENFASFMTKKSFLSKTLMCKQQEVTRAIAKAEKKVPEATRKSNAVIALAKAKVQQSKGFIGVFALLESLKACNLAPEDGGCKTSLKTVLQSFDDEGLGAWMNPVLNSRATAITQHKARNEKRNKKEATAPKSKKGRTAVTPSGPDIGAAEQGPPQSMAAMEAAAEDAAPGIETTAEAYAATEFDEENWEDEALGAVLVEEERPSLRRVMPQSFKETGTEPTAGGDGEQEPGSAAVELLEASSDDDSEAVQEAELDSKRARTVQGTVGASAVGARVRAKAAKGKVAAKAKVAAAAKGKVAAKAKVAAAAKGKAGKAAANGKAGGAAGQKAGKDGKAGTAPSPSVWEMLNPSRAGV